jgi:hypothetical protein
MSHFSNIKTKIRNLNSLTAALSDLGIEWKDGDNTPVRGYQGDTRTAQAIVEQENGYDIGFCFNGEEYELVTDLQFWQQAWSVDRFINKVSQRYAYHTVMEQATKQGFQVAEEKNQQDGSIRLVVQRWA